MFRALRVDEPSGDDGNVDLIDDLEIDALMPGDVDIDVAYSSINYKDGMALAGKPGVIKSYPLIPGIDLVGTVRESDNDQWKTGDHVILNGWGIGETHHGGLAERARVKADWLVPLPAGMTAKHAAAIGTAGFTAMLSLLALEKSGSLPAPGDTDETVLVTGAAGGLGSVAIALLAGRGYRVAASTGRPELADYLRSLGATQIIERASLAEPGEPLQKQRWAGAIDSVGGTTLANILSQTKYGGTVACCGVAQSRDLPTTVMPFVLRAVTLAGINSVFAPRELRIEAWGRLAADLDVGLLDQLTTTIGLADVENAARDILGGAVRGRIVVDVRA